ncbi:hypothetical protein D3C72_2326420 [compost metagenome]
MLLGGRDDGFGHEVGLGDDGLDCHALGVALGLHAIDHGLCRIAPLGFDALDVVGIDGHAALEVTAGVAGHHLEGHGRGAGERGQRQSVFHGLVGKG